MNPRKVKDLIEPVAHDLGIPSDHVGALIKYYYRYMKIQMQELKGVEFYVSGLGAFGIQGWKLDKELEKVTRSYNKKVSDNTKALADVELKKVQRVKELWDADILRSKEIKKKKREHKNKSNES